MSRRWNGQMRDLGAVDDVADAATCDDARATDCDLPDEANGARNYGRRREVLPKIPQGAAPRETYERDAILAIARGYGEGRNAYRRLWCRSYWKCLDFAAASGWDNFTCRGCPIEDELTAQERREQNAALGILHRTVSA